MLTVKQIEFSGHSIVIEAESVSYQPSRRETLNGNILSQAQLFAYPGNNGQPLVFANGRVFVMNDKGRTIDQHDLDEDNRAPVMCTEP